jgi:hypothetical protein
MTKENKKKVKSKASPSPKYVTSDKNTLFSDNYDSSDDNVPLPNVLVENPNTMIKGLMRQVGARDEILEQQENFLIQERKISEELKKLLTLEKAKVKSLTKNLLKVRRLLVVSRSQLLLFKINMISC